MEATETTAATQRSMANSSILGGTPAHRKPSGADVDALGPSDSSDSGSDVQGEMPMATAPDNRGEWGAVPSKKNSDSDSMGTGERAAASGNDVEDGADIMPDHLVGRGGASLDLDSAAGGEALRDLAVLGADDASEEPSGTEDESMDPVGRRK